MLCTLLVSGTAFAQDTYQILEPDLNLATLDSAIRYELLKPVVTALKTENLHLGQENLQLRILLELKDRESAQDKRLYMDQLAILRKRGIKKVLAGAAAGALGTLIISKL